MQVDGNADHAQIVVQELLADGVRRPVGGDADRLAQLVEEGIKLLQGIAGHVPGHGLAVAAGRRLVGGQHLLVVQARVERLPGAGADVDPAGGAGPLPKRDLLGLGEGGVPDLLGITVDVAGHQLVDPHAVVAAGLDVLQVAHEAVALVLLQVLFGVNRIAGLDAGINGVEDLRLDLQVVAQPLVVLVPIGILDDQPELGVDRLARLDQLVDGGMVQGLEAVLRPALGPLGGDVRGVLRRREKPVVEDQLVEMAGGGHGDALHAVEIALIGIGPAGDRGGRDENAVVDKELLHRVERRLADLLAVGGEFEIDLVELDLMGHGLVVGGQFLQVAPLGNLAPRDVDRHAEVLVLARAWAGAWASAAGEMKAPTSSARNVKATMFFIKSSLKKRG